jgi:hypothetical protein
MDSVKLPGHRPGLPGKELSFHIVPLDPADKAGLTRHLPAKITLLATYLRVYSLR